MNQELNEKIATEIMGWEYVPYTAYCGGTPEQATKIAVEKGWYCWEDANGDEVILSANDFSSDPVACYAMEEKIKEMGLMREYGLSLARELGLFDDEREMDDWEGKDVFAIAHASPEIRCIAALEMMATRASKSDPTQG